MDFMEVGAVIVSPGFLPWVLASLGFAFGGFVTVAADRLSRLAKAEDNGDTLPDDCGLWYPPSRCEGCKRELSALERLPLIGWPYVKVFAAGKCKKCGYKVPFSLPLVELFTIIGFFIIGKTYADNWLEAVSYSIMLWFMITLILADLTNMLLPDRLTIPLLWGGLVAASLGLISVTAASSILGAALGYLSFWFIREMFFWLRGKVALGGGDLKLLAALGAWAGWQSLPFIAGLAAIIALILYVVLAVLRLKSLKDYMPFGPSLIIAGAWLIFRPDDIIIAMRGIGAVLGLH